MVFPGITAEPSSPYPDGETLVQKAPWGNLSDGSPVDRFVLQSPQITVELSNYGARLLSVAIHGDAGESTHVVLGMRSVAEYEADQKTYMGAVVGRYANRIAHGRFSLHGKQYQVPTNDPPNSLHGGHGGFDRQVWSSALLPNGVEFALTSPDGDMGFPGRLEARVRYTLQGGELRIDFAAQSDQATVVNLTNHAYFNLAGESSGNVLDHVMTIAADRFTPTTETMIPTGEQAGVAETSFDFRQAKSIGEGLACANDQLDLARGFDHNYVLRGEGLREVAVAVDPATGRSLTVLTTEPGLQFYSGNFLDGSLTGLSGTRYEKHAGFCLETQHFPDSPNQPAFPSTVIEPGNKWESASIFRFR